ncbi:MAG: N-acetyltransferase [Flavobacteriaceae bacterium]|nr:N-acetyltransferase [Flavobacteriaceae bacterium]
MIDAAELIDNEFLRQFELKIDNELAKIEYSLQERKIFLTKLIIPDNVKNDDFVEDFLKVVMENIQERNISVVPTSPPIAKFIRKHRRYKSMLPVGVRI